MGTLGGWITAGLIVGSIAFGLFYLWRNRTIQATECGHSTKIRGTFTAFGETIWRKLLVKGNRTEYCHVCLGAMTIQCAWCSAPIFIGDRVTLFLADNERPLPEGSREYFHEGGVRAFIGCVGCADMGAFDAQGIWMPPPEGVRRIPSGTEMALAAFRGGAPAFIMNY